MGILTALVNFYSWAQTNFDLFIVSWNPTKLCLLMPRLILGVVVFCILAYTIGYFKVLIQKPQKSDGTPKSAFEEGSRILILMIGIGLMVFAVFVLYQFGTYFLDKK